MKCIDSDIICNKYILKICHGPGIVLGPEDIIPNKIDILSAFIGLGIMLVVSIIFFSILLHENNDRLVSFFKETATNQVTLKVTYHSLA